MFLEKVFSGKNDFGRWLALILIVLTGLQIIGLIPLGTAMFLRLNDNPDLTPDPDNILDFTSYEISPVIGFALTVIPFVFGTIALFSLIKPIHERPLISLFTAGKSFRWNNFFWGMSVWLLLISFYTVIAGATGLQKIELQFQPRNLISLILFSLVLLPFQAGFEETFFRGYLLQGFTNVFLNKWMPLLLTTLLFGIFQYLNPEIKAFGQSVMLPHFIWFGIFLGVCTIMDDGLEIALGIHIVNNVFYTVFFTQQTDAIPTPALFNIIDSNSLVDLVGLIIIFLVFLHLGRKRFDWPAWNSLFVNIQRPENPEEEESFQNYGLFGEYEEYDEKDEN